MTETENDVKIISEWSNRKLNRTLALTKRNVCFVLVLLAAAISLSVYFAVDGRINGNNNTSLSSVTDSQAPPSAVISDSKFPTASPRVRAPHSKASSPTKAYISPPTNAPFVDTGIVETTNRPLSIRTTESPTQSPRMSSSTTAPTIAQTSSSEPFTDYVATSYAEVTIHDGSALDSTIPYYHCSGGGDSLSHFVLLHGASFSRDNWKRSGVLDLLCAWENVAVTAVDLPVSAKRDDLRRLLEALPNDLSSVSPNIPKKKVAALVSPSASGSTVIDWLLSPDDVRDLHGWVQTWIPVACGSVLLADEDLLQAGLTANHYGNWPVLAIHGDRDSSRSSDKLKELSPETTTIVELPGPHAVYLHSQKTFVETILESVANNRRAQSAQ